MGVALEPLSNWSKCDRHSLLWSDIMLAYIDEGTCGIGAHKGGHQK